MQISTHDAVRIMYREITTLNTS